MGRWVAGRMALAVALMGAALAASAPQAPRAQDDLFLHANQQWLHDTPIPDDRVTYSASTALVDLVEQRVQTLISELQQGPLPPTGTEARLIVDLYQSVVDRAEVERRGLDPIREDLAQFDAVTTLRKASALAGRLSVKGEGGPFGVTLATAGREARGTVARVAIGGLLLPDWSYYLTPTRDFLQVRRAYAAYLVRVFEASGQSTADAENAAGVVIAFETTLAEAARKVRGQSLSPRVWSLAGIERTMPGFGWREWAKPQGLDRAAGLMLDHPEYFRAFAEAFGRATPAAVSAWLRARYLTAVAPYLPDVFSNARFDFFGTELTGQVEPREPWKRGVSMVSEFLGDAVGRRYVTAHFSPVARARVQAMVSQVLEAAREAVAQSEWMSDDDRETNLARLATVETKVGYPDDWREYTGLVIDPADLIGNVRRLRDFDLRYRMRRAPVARTSREWLMTPHAVNAYYSPAQHEIVIPAGILQAPYFDPALDEAWNYGAIGAVIGHEVVHALSLRGVGGRVRGVRQQLGRFEVVPGVSLNADLTFAESLADVLGLQLAHRAYRRSLGAAATQVIDGLSGDQRFLVGWARMWRGQSRPDYLRSTNKTSPHAPSRVRANGAVSHVMAFYAAFGVVPGDQLYLPPDARVRVW